MAVVAAAASRSSQHLQAAVVSPSVLGSSVEAGNPGARPASPTRLRKARTVVPKRKAQRDASLLSASSPPEPAYDSEAARERIQPPPISEESTESTTAGSNDSPSAGSPSLAPGRAQVMLGTSSGFSKRLAEQVARVTEELAKEREAELERDVQRLRDRILLLQGSGVSPPAPTIQEASLRGCAAPLDQKQQQSSMALAAAGRSWKRSKPLEPISPSDNEDWPGLHASNNSTLYPRWALESPEGSASGRPLLKRGQTEGRLVIKDLMKAAKSQEFERRSQRGHGSSIIQIDDKPLIKDAEKLHQAETILHHAEVATLLVSLISAVVVGFEADYEWDGWLWINGFMLLFFWGDIAVNLYFLGLCRYLTGPGRAWNQFDLITTSLSTVDWLNDVIKSWGFRTISLAALRILRIVRLAKFLRGEIFKDLNALIYGFLYGLSPLFWAVFLMMVVSYGLGLLMRLSVGDPDDGSPPIGQSYFGDVPTAMFNVFRCLNSDCTSIEGQPLVLKVGDHYGWVPKFLYTVIVLVITLGLLNVVLALFVERVLEGAKYSQAMRMRMEKKNESFLKSIEKQLGWVDDFAEDYYSKHPEELTHEQELMISEQCFLELLRDQRFVQVLEDLGIAMEDMNICDQDLFMIVSPDGLPITFQSLFQELSYMRGEARVTLQVLSLLTQNKTMKLLQKLAEKWDVSLVEDQQTAADPHAALSNGVIRMRGVTREIEVVVGDVTSSAE